MYCEVPIFKRCCLCLPLRFGLIGYGYLKLITIIGITLWIGPVMLWYVAMQNFFYACFLVILLADFSLTVALVIGGHIKNVLLLTIYMWYMVVSAIGQVALSTFVLCAHAHLRTVYTYNVVMSTVASVCFQLYLIFCLWSEIAKQQEQAEERNVVHYQMGGETIRVKPLKPERV